MALETTPGGVDSFMGNLIRPVQTKVVTKDGELVIHMTLDLNINLTTGNLSVTASPSAPKAVEEKEDTQWEIPDFTVPDTKLNFGKTVQNEQEE